MAGTNDRLAEVGAMVYTPEMLELQGAIHHRMLRETDFASLENMNNTQLTEHTRRFALQVLSERDLTLPGRTLEQLIACVIYEVTGFGPLEVLLSDDTISEIMVNGPDQIMIEREGKLSRVPIRFADGDHIMRIIEKIIAPLGRRLDEAVPMVDARLPDGSRVNAIIPPLALHGPYLTIRKFAADPLTDEDLVRFNSMSTQMRDFMQCAVEGKLNIMVSGGTGSGKTTTLNVLSSFIPSGERIITIEDAAELQLQQDHVLTLESRPANLEGTGQIAIRDLVRNSLRMRPDRIVVGEVRGGEALDMLQAMNTGHEGSLSTAHTNGPRDCLARLETMVLMAGTELPSHAIRQQISSAVDLIIHQDRMRDGTRKITHMTEVQRMEGAEIITQDLFLLHHLGVGDDGKLIVEHRPVGVQPLFVDKMAAEGVDLPAGIFTPQEETTIRRGIFG
jgi:pilus assembly protein CpaF